MTSQRTPSARASEVVDYNARRARVRDAIQAVPASTIGLGTRFFATFVSVPLIAGLVVVIASALVYGRQAAGLDVTPQYAAQVWLVLGALFAMSVAASFLALSPGRRGFGVGVSVLAAGALSVAPIYAALVLTGPAHTNNYA